MVATGRKLTPDLSRRWLGALILLALALALLAVAAGGQGRAGAEGSPQLVDMSVSIMPEYDQQSVLVSYRGDLDPAVSLPLQTRLRVPADAEIAQVCSIKQPGEEHLCQEYSVEPDGQYLALTWEAVTPTLYVEFYYGSVSGAGRRSLDFTFMPPYPVQNLDLFVLEPMDATDFTLSPAPAEVVEEQGVRHHTYSFQDVSADEPLSIEISYARPTDEPLAPPRAAAAAAAVADADADADSSGGIPQGVILALGLAGAVVLASALYSAFARRFRVRLVAASGPEPEDEGAEARSDTLFCRQCGGSVRPGSAFCAACGQAVRPPPKELE